MTVQTAHAIVEKYEYYSPVDARRDEDLGKSDVDALLLDREPGELSEREKGFYAEANGDLERYNIAVEHEKDRLEKNIEAVDYKVNVVFGGRRAKEQQDYAHAQDRLAKSEGPDSPKWQDLETKHAEARQDYLDRQDDEGERPMRRFIHPRSAQGVLILLAVVEATINVSSFALFVDGPLLFSYLAAFAAGGVLMWLAHLGGLEIRTLGTRPTTRTRVGFTVRAVVFYIGFAGFLLYFIALSRQGYLNLQTGSARFDVRGALQNVNVAIDLTKLLFGFKLEPVGWALLTVNVGVYLMGGLATFFAHDPNLALERAFDRMNRLGRRFECQKGRYNSKSLALQRRHARRLARVERDAARVHAWSNGDRTELKQLEGARKATKSMVFAYVDQRIASYRMGAQKAAARFGKKVPFREHTPHLPYSLRVKDGDDDAHNVENVHPLRARVDG